MGNKSLGEDYLTIKDFAELVGINVSALRHYDKMGVFLPAKHGIEFENQYRYYSPLQITTVKMIRVLAEIGVPLKTIKELTKNRTPEMLLKLLSKNKDILADELRFLTDVYSVICTFHELLIEGISVTETDVYVSERPEKRIILGGINDFGCEPGFLEAFTRFCMAHHIPKLNMSYPIGGYFENMAAFQKEPAQPTRFFSLDPKGQQKKEAGLYLIGYTRGYYGQTNDLPEKLTAVAKKNGLIFSGPIYNLYLFDEVSTIDPEQYLLQVSASVTETQRVSSRRPRHHL
jgi:DNA-binding transcriptional MerR regulator